jgi:DNA-binding HxlR family transcriptional regulator
VRASRGKPTVSCSPLVSCHAYPGTVTTTGESTSVALGFERIDEEKCRTFQNAVELVGKKWTAGILLAGMRGARRFVEYRAHGAGISDKLLAARLRELEADDLIERIVVPTTPVLVTYRPSRRAVSLMRALHPLVEWSIRDRRHVRRRQ